MNFNKKKGYEQNIKEKVDALILECRKEQVPCFISVAVANNEKETVYNNLAVTPNFLNMNLSDDKIADHINVMNGFKTVPYTELYDRNKTVVDEEEYKDWSEGQEFEEIIPQ